MASTSLLSSRSLDNVPRCCICRTKPVAPRSDPLYPVFPFFSLTSCSHYSCQPCALAFSTHNGQWLYCPDCGAESRLAQKGKVFAGNSTLRVALDDGASSVMSLGSRGVAVRSFKSGGSVLAHGSNVPLARRSPVVSILDGHEGNKGARRRNSATGLDRVPNPSTDGNGVPLTTAALEASMKGRGSDAGGEATLTVQGSNLFEIHTTLRRSKSLDAALLRESLPRPAAVATEPEPAVQSSNAPPRLSEIGAEVDQKRLETPDPVSTATALAMQSPDRVRDESGRPRHALYGDSGLEVSPATPAARDEAPRSFSAQGGSPMAGRTGAVSYRSAATKQMTTVVTTTTTWTASSTRLVEQRLSGLATKRSGGNGDDHDDDDDDHSGAGNDEENMQEDPHHRGDFHTDVATSFLNQSAISVQSARSEVIGAVAAARASSSPFNLSQDGEPRISPPATPNSKQATSHGNTPLKKSTEKDGCGASSPLEVLKAFVASSPPTNPAPPAASEASLVQSAAGREEIEKSPPVSRSRSLPSSSASPARAENRPIENLTLLTDCAALSSEEEQVRQYFVGDEEVSIRELCAAFKMARQRQLEQEAIAARKTDDSSAYATTGAFQQRNEERFTQSNAARSVTVASKAELQRRSQMLEIQSQLFNRRRTALIDEESLGRSECATNERISFQMLASKHDSVIQELHRAAEILGSFREQQLRVLSSTLSEEEQRRQFLLDDEELSVQELLTTFHKARNRHVEIAALQELQRRNEARSTAARSVTVASKAHVSEAELQRRSQMLEMQSQLFNRRRTALIDEESLGRSECATNERISFQLLASKHDSVIQELHRAAEILQNSCDASVAALLEEESTQRMQAAAAQHALWDGLLREHHHIVEEQTFAAYSKRLLLRLVSQLSDSETTARRILVSQSHDQLLAHMNEATALHFRAQCELSERHSLKLLRRLLSELCDSESAGRNKITNSQSHTFAQIEARFLDASLALQAMKAKQRHNAMILRGVWAEEFAIREQIQRAAETVLSDAITVWQLETPIVFSPPRKQRMPGSSTSPFHGIDETDESQGPVQSFEEMVAALERDEATSRRSITRDLIDWFSHTRKAMQQRASSFQLEVRQLFLHSQQKLFEAECVERNNIADQNAFARLLLEREADEARTRIEADLLSTFAVSFDRLEAEESLNRSQLHDGLFAALADTMRVFAEGEREAATRRAVSMRSRKPLTPPTSPAKPTLSKSTPEKHGSRVVAEPKAHQSHVPTAAPTVIVVPTPPPFPPTSPPRKQQQQQSSSSPTDMHSLSSFSSSAAAVLTAVSPGVPHSPVTYAARYEQSVAYELREEMILLRNREQTLRDSIISEEYHAFKEFTALRSRAFVRRANLCEAATNTSGNFGASSLPSVDSLNPIKEGTGCVTTGESQQASATVSTSHHSSAHYEERVVIQRRSGSRGATEARQTDSRSTRNYVRATLDSPPRHVQRPPDVSSSALLTAAVEPHEFLYSEPLATFRKASSLTANASSRRRDLIREAKYREFILESAQRSTDHRDLRVVDSDHDEEEEARQQREKMDDEAADERFDRVVHDAEKKLLVERQRKQLAESASAAAAASASAAVASSLSKIRRGRRDEAGLIEPPSDVEDEDCRHSSKDDAAGDADDGGSYAKKGLFFVPLFPEKGDKTKRPKPQPPKNYEPQEQPTRSQPTSRRPSPEVRQARGRSPPRHVSADSKRNAQMAVDAQRSAAAVAGSAALHAVQHGFAAAMLKASLPPSSLARPPPLRSRSSSPAVDPQKGGKQASSRAEEQKHHQAAELRSQLLAHSHQAAAATVKGSAFFQQATTTTTTVTQSSHTQQLQTHNLRTTGNIADLSDDRHQRVRLMRQSRTVEEHTVSLRTAAADNNNNLQLRQSSSIARRVTPQAALEAHQVQRAPNVQIRFNVMHPAGYVAATAAQASRTMLLATGTYQRTSSRTPSPNQRPTWK
jgi:hypothetical protein